MRPPEDEVRRRIVREWLYKADLDIRYPGGQPEPDLEEARRALELARMVRDAVLPVLPGPSDRQDA